MMLDEDQLIVLISKNNQKIQMKELNIKQSVYNSVLRTDIVQKFNFENRFYILYKDNPYRKKLEIQFGDRIVKTKLEENSKVKQNQNNGLNLAEQILDKYQDYKVIELQDCNYVQKENDSITVKFSQIGKILCKLSCMYYIIIKQFSKQLLEGIKNYNLNIYLNASSQIDFLKVQSKAKTSIWLQSSKRSASISQQNQATMEDLILYYRHKNIGIPQISFGREKNNQIILMIDYLPPFNVEQNFRKCLKESQLSNKEKESQLQFALESIEFCIVMDTSSSLMKFDTFQMKYLLNQSLQYIENTIVKTADQDSDNPQQKISHYISFSYLDSTGWVKSGLQEKQNTIEQHFVIKNQLFPQIEWKKEKSNLKSFLKDFQNYKNNSKIPRILFLITQGLWIDFDESLIELQSFYRNTRNLHPYQAGNCLIDQKESQQETKNDQTKNNQKEIQQENSNDSPQKPKETQDNLRYSEILDVFLLYQGKESIEQQKIPEVITKEKFFTRTNIEEFPQDLLQYLKKHSDFFIETLSQDIECSTLPLKQHKEQQKNDFSLNFNQIFQQFIVLKQNSQNFLGFLRFFDWRIRQQYQVKIQFPSQQKDDQKDYLEANDIASAGLIQLIQCSNNLSALDFIKKASNVNSIHTQFNNEVFKFYDLNQNLSSDSSIQEIQISTQKTSQKASSIKSQNPQIIKYSTLKVETNLKISEIPLEIVQQKTTKLDKIQEKSVKKANQILQNQINSPKILQLLVNNFEDHGFWKYSEVLLNLISFNKERFLEIKRKISQCKVEHNINNLIMTCIILICLRIQFKSYYGSWQNCQLKSTKWIDASFPQNVYVKVLKYAKEEYDKSIKK